MNQKLNEEDLKKIFSKGSQSGKNIKNVLDTVAIFIIIFILAYATINFNALTRIFSYWYQTEVSTDSNDNASNLPPEIVAVEPGRKLQVNKNNLPGVAENHILLPRIEVDAPINWQVNNETDTIQEKLKSGVVQLNGTSLPGEKGNVFITGHSSNYFWAKGNYKNIFALLGNMSSGDLVYIKYRGVTFIYKISSTKVVKPSDTSVLKQDSGSYLTLMTCTPVGTSINRLIVKAEQIQPDPVKNIDPSGAAASSLPTGVR